MSAFSSSTELIHSPPDLMTSLARSVICRYPFGGDGADVAGAQPAVVELLGGRVPPVRGGDPRTSHLDLADVAAVPGQLPAIVVDDAQLHAGDGAPGLGAPVELLGAPRSHVGRGVADRADRGHLGHAPPLDEAEAVALLEPLHERARQGGAAAHDEAQ